MHLLRPNLARDQAAHVLGEIAGYPGDGSGALPIGCYAPEYFEPRSAARQASTVDDGVQLNAIAKERHCTRDPVVGPHRGEFLRVIVNLVYGNIGLCSGGGRSGVRNRHFDHQWSNRCRSLPGR